MFIEHGAEVDDVDSLLSMCFFLFWLWLIDYIFFAILKKFVASTWIVIWKSLGRYGVHSYCCRPFQNQLDHHMVSQQLQIITIYHFLLITKFNSTLENWWGGNFATFQRLLWTNCVAVALTILRVTQWRKEGTAWWSSFQIIMMPTMTTAMHVFPGSHLCNVRDHLGSSP